MNLSSTSLSIAVIILFSLVASGCGGNGENTDATKNNNRFDTLQDWRRVGDPVLRDPEPGRGFEVAADPHVFRNQDGALRMVYTGPHPDNDFATIKLATANSHTNWNPGPVLLTGSNADGIDINKETSFYRLSDSGKHQVYYIGYQDINAYASQVFLAEADTLEGPYTLPMTPVIPNGLINGYHVKTITSPSIVEHEGSLYMVYCAWNDFPVPTIVEVHGAISDDDGQSWDRVGEVNVPSCMEGSFTKGPDGLFYATAQSDGGITIGRSSEPFPDDGYEMLASPIMTPAGAPWEIDELNTPQLFFEGETAYLYYSGADNTKGWWVMLSVSHLTQ